MFLLFGRALAPVFLHPLQDGGKNLEKVYYNQHQQPICSSTFFFYINNKSRPTSTIHVQVNIRNMPKSTTKESQHQQIPRFFNDHVPQKQRRT